MVQETDSFPQIGSDPLGPTKLDLASLVCVFVLCPGQLYAHSRCSIGICGRNKVGHFLSFYASQSTWISWNRGSLHFSMFKTQPGHPGISSMFINRALSWVFTSNGERQVWGLLFVGLLSLFLPTDSYFFPDPLLPLDLNSLPTALHLLTNCHRLQTHPSQSMPATR